MATIIRKIKEISFIMALALLFFSLTLLFVYSVEASEVTTPMSKEDSMYRYNSLENKVSFPDAGGNLDRTDEEVSKSVVLIDSTESKLYELTLRQEFSIGQIKDSINILKDRSGFKTFMVGNSLGALRFQLVQIKDQARLLDALAQDEKDSAIKTQIENQAIALREEQIRVEDFIFEQESKFSLFGWLVDMM